MKKTFAYIFSICFLITVSASSSATDCANLDALAKQIATGIASSFGLRTAQVLSTKGEDGVYINLGERDSITKGDRFEVYAKTLEIIRGTDGKFKNYNSEKLAVVEVEWTLEDYSFTKIIEHLSERKVDTFDLLISIQPVRAFFVREFKGKYGAEITPKIVASLGEMPNVKIADLETEPEYYVDGMVEECGFGMNAKVLLFKSGTTKPILTIEKYVENSPSDNDADKDSYQTYLLEEKVGDFISLGNDKLIFLGERELLIARITLDEIVVDEKIPIDFNPLKPTREPIGRMRLFDLDGDGVSELLVSNAEQGSGQFFIAENDKFTLGGYIPGIPLDADKSGHLLTSAIMPGLNLFNPQKTNLQTVSQDGVGGVRQITSISSPFFDAALVNINSDDKPELAVVTSDGKLVIKSIDENGDNLNTSIAGAGQGIFQDTDGLIYTSSSGWSYDFIVTWGLEGGRLVELARSVPLTSKIYRIGKIDSRIAALGLDEKGRSVLIIFNDIQAV